jgi:hypothetical protein
MSNVFKYTKQLEEAGFSREQAEIQLQVITEIDEGDLATKQDLKILETSMLNAIEIKSNNLENKVQQLEYRLTIKLGAFLVIGFTTMATLMKFWLAR